MLRRPRSVVQLQQRPPVNEAHTGANVHRTHLAGSARNQQPRYAAAARRNPATTPAAPSERWRAVESMSLCCSCSRVFTLVCFGDVTRKTLQLARKTSGPYGSRRGCGRINGPPREERSSRMELTTSSYGVFAVVSRLRFSPLFPASHSARTLSKRDAPPAWPEALNTGRRRWQGAPTAH